MLKITRQMEFSDRTIGIKGTRKVRDKPSAFYRSKLWIMRFQN
jgi:hypothetical protein